VVEEDGHDGDGPQAVEAGAVGQPYLGGSLHRGVSTPSPGACPCVGHP
jgi:hypothetical protein